MSTTTTKKRAPAKSSVRRKKTKSYDQIAAQAERELDRAFKKDMQLLEEETDGKAFVLTPEPPRTMNASEALFSFVGWLTTRDKPVILSAHHTAGVPAELVGLFIKENSLPELREDWNHVLISMKDVAIELTNDPALNPNKVAPPPPTFEEAFKQILGLFRFFHDQRQNHLFARLIEELSETRLSEFHRLSDHIERQTARHTQLAAAAKELDQVLSGNFTIVHV